MNPQLGNDHPDDYFHQSLSHHIRRIKDELKTDYLGVSVDVNMFTLVSDRALQELKKEFHYWDISLFLDGRGVTLTRKDDVSL
jgi:hypothetical protein